MIAEQKYFNPVSVNEAIALALQYKDNCRFLAGGTDLIVNKFQGNEKGDCLIDLSGIDELKKVEKISALNRNSSTADLNSNGEAHEFIKIGSLICLDDLENYSEIREEFPVLITAAHAVASPVIRKSATIGGNILCENRCVFYNQSEWWRESVGHCLKCDGELCIATGGKKACFSKCVSDLAPALISLDALIEIREKKKTRRMKLEDLYTGDGIDPRKFKKNEIICSILLPLDQKFRSSFHKLRQRESLDFSSLTTCVSVNKNGKIKIVLGGVDPAPVVVEGLMENKIEIIKKAVKKSRIVDNDVFSRKYRQEMIKVFLERSFSELFSVSRLYK